MANKANHPAHHDILYEDKKEWHTGDKPMRYDLEEWDKDKVEKFWEVVREKMKDEDFDFSDVFFPIFTKENFWQDYQKEFYGGVNFENTIFYDGANFHNKTFSGISNFKNSHFLEIADFNSSTFKILDFTDAQFSNELDLGHAKFYRWVDFNNIKVSHDVNLTNSEFLNEVNFKNSKFYEKFDFDYVKLRIVNFTNSQFDKEFNFHNTTFSDKAKFTDVTFGKEADFSSSGTLLNEIRGGFSFKEINFNKVVFLGGVDFTNRIFTEKTSFRNSIFYKSPNFHDAELHQNTDFGGIRFKKSCYSGESSARDFRTLKLAMEDKRARQEELLFFACEQKSLRYEKIKDLKDLSLWRGRFTLVDIAFSYLYEAVTDYGTSYLRPLAWLGVILLGFGLIYSGEDVSFIEGLRLSFRQATSLFSIWKTNEYSLAMQLVSTLETILSFTVAYLFLQALRRRFKMS